MSAFKIWSQWVKILTNQGVPEKTKDYARSFLTRCRGSISTRAHIGLRRLPLRVGQMAKYSSRFMAALGVRPQARIDAGIFAGGSQSQPVKIMRPALGVAGALRGVRKTAMGHAHQGAAVPVDQVDLDQA